jgi:cell division protein ZapD
LIIDKTVKKKILYEHPLNERMRTLLRLEYLFDSIMYHLKGPAEWESRAVIERIIEGLELITRIDIKSLYKDLEYHTQTLERWQRTPEVDTQRLSQLLNQIQHLKTELENTEGQLNEYLTQHQLFNLVRQRMTIAGGSYRCDLPGYHYWLQKSPKQRQSQINEWLAPLQPLRDAVELDLYLIRNNASVSQEIASNGFFQSKLEANLSYLIIQVYMPQEHFCYPEISGGKQRFTIRFFEQPLPQEQPRQTEQDVSFELRCCVVA